MKEIFLVACSIAGLIAFPANLPAWDGAGHMMIAAEAFSQLPPELKAQAIEVLKNHPDYQQWVAAYHPNPDYDQAAYVVMRSSTWPDEIRRSGSPYDHPEWHFIDYPLRPPAFTFEPDAQPENDILFGVALSEQRLSDTNADPVLRAVSLSWLIHLVGDIHQPLHCESYYDDQFPNGDRGGNDFYVKSGQQPMRLHPIWDGLLGEIENATVQWKYAHQLDAKFPRASLPELTEHATPLSWSLESRKLAIEYGYLYGHLRGGTNAETAFPLPADYLSRAKSVAERRGALAGYRLCDALENYLVLGRLAPLLPPNTNIVAEALPEEIGTALASRYYDQDMVVTGKVAHVIVRASIAILDLDQPYPDTPMTAVVFDQNFAAFGDLQRYNGHHVALEGTITEYHSKPEMVLESPQQIKITDSSQ
ncbi:MAG: S1/P1 nuclease [Limisphaerales bacterium]